MSDALNASWTALAELALRLLGAGFVMFVAFLAALLLRRFATRLLTRIGFDSLLERMGAATSSLQRVGLSGRPAVVVGSVIFWVVLLAGAAAALSVLGLSSLQENMDLIVVLAGKALIAVLILVGGLAVADWLSNLATRQAEEAGLRGTNAFGRAIFAAVLAVAALLAATHLGINVSLLVVLVVVFLGTVGLVAALALGVGLAPLSGNVAAGRYVRGNNIRLGDEISVDGVEGTVEEMGYASITLRSEDDSLHHVPNRLLIEGVVTKRPQKG